MRGLTAFAPVPVVAVLAGRGLWCLSALAVHVVLSCMYLQQLDEQQAQAAQHSGCEGPEPGGGAAEGHTNLQV